MFIFEFPDPFSIWNVKYFAGALRQDVIRALFNLKFHLSARWYTCFMFHCYFLYLIATFFVLALKFILLNNRVISYL